MFRKIPVPQYYVLVKANYKLIQVILVSGLEHFRYLDENYQSQLLEWRGGMKQLRI